jgi:bifunctional UDP-N-acetylglucosamine pyrophosphorylase / glucosamine-1-phosphate N-acetyltransferase
MGKNRSMPYRPLSAVVLAAGEGRRMRSTLPKPLHLIAGRPMVLHVLEALSELSLERVVVVVGYRSAEMTKAISSLSPSDLKLHFVEQPLARGTGDAVAVALTAFPDDDMMGNADVIVLPGDAPLLRPATLRALVEEHQGGDAAVTLLTAILDDPSGCGRIVRSDQGDVERIVEDRDAFPDELEIAEVGTSIYCFRQSLLAPSLRRLRPNNTRGEYHLTDVVEGLARSGYVVGSLVVGDSLETTGVNDRAQLSVAEAEMRARINERWMRAGVTMIDPASTYVDLGVELAEDVTLWPSTYLGGGTRIGREAVIGPAVRLVDTVVGERAFVEFTSAQGATIGKEAHVGPFADLAAGSEVPDTFETGPFFKGVASRDAGSQPT